jgi:hypothetical protein
VTLQLSFRAQLRAKPRDWGEIGGILWHRALRGPHSSSPNVSSRRGAPRRGAQEFPKPLEGEEVIEKWKEHTDQYSPLGLPS